MLVKSLASVVTKLIGQKLAHSKGSLPFLSKRVMRAVFWSLCRAPFLIAKLNEFRISGNTISQIAEINSEEFHHYTWSFVLWQSPGPVSVHQGT